MFTKLSQNILSAFDKIRSSGGQLSDAHVQEAIKKLRQALLDADVHLSVAKTFLQSVKRQAVGKKVPQGVRPSDFMVKIVYDALVDALGETHTPFMLRTRPPVILLVVGLQGAGKTTTIGKLVHWLITREKRTVMTASVDVYRDGARAQLQQVTEQAGGHYYAPTDSVDQPLDIAQAAKHAATQQLVDVLIIDTAGRLHVDAAMMQEAAAIHACLSPQETYFVLDSMTGQDALLSAKAFHDTLPLTGIILTKTDGDARGGAALSARHVTQVPIVFMGTGETKDDFESFHPDRIASRILQMGDILSLVEEAEHKLDLAHSKRVSEKLQKGKGLDLNDLLIQIKQMRQMGGMHNVMQKIPGMAGLSAQMAGKVDDDLFDRMRAMIQSMTPKERQNPALIANNPSRKRRIAKGSGTQVPEINRLLKQFNGMQKVMKKWQGNKMRQLMGKLTSGDLPPDLF